MVAGAFGSCIDLHATWTKGFDANNCPIVTFSSNKEGLEDCDVAVGPYLKTLTVNGNEMNVSDLLADVNFEYVPYDQATHVPGPLLGTGTPADPFQVPVKECNFAFVDYDPDEHIEGQPIEGDGTAVNPWQIPVKQCNFEYVPYEPVIHDEGVIEGDGTEDNPWQIPFKECNFNYVPYDPEIHDYDDPIEGDGTAEDPWQIPVKECNFEYVAYNPAVHTFGSIAGDGTAANPWQIPLFELDSDVKICAVRIVNTPVGGQNVYSFEYDLCDKDGNVVDTLVAANVPVPTFSDKQGNPLVGDIELLVPSDFVDRGNNYYEAAGLHGINSAGECELFSPPTWAYVPYDPDTHSDELQGVGTEADPFEIPIVPPKECNFVYVDFDPAIHGETDSGNSPIVGDGTTANPWQIPRPCCEEVCSPSSDTCDIAAATLIGPTAGGADEPVSLQAVEVACGQKGNFVANGAGLLEASDHWDGTTFPLNIPVPVATPGNVLALHVSYGSALLGSGTDGYVSGLTLSKAGSDVGDPNQICSDEYWEYGSTVRPMLGNSVFLFDVATGGSASSVTVDFANKEAGFAADTGTGAFDGAISWHWVEISSNDPALSAADFEIKGEYGIINNDETTGNNADAPIDAGPCDSLHFAMHRHAMGEPPYQFTDPQTDYFDGCYPGIWNDAQVGIAGYDQLYSNVTFNATSSPCQVGSASGFIEGGTGPITYNHLGNNVGTNGREFGGGCVMGLIACEPISTIPEETVDSQICEVTLPAPACDSTLSCVFTAEGNITLDADETVSVVPVIDGVTIESERVDLDNTNGTFSFNVTTASTAVAAGATPPTVTALIRADFAGEGEVSITAGELECTLTPS